MFGYYECKDGTSSKFYNVERVSVDEVVVTYGRIGTDGNSITMFIDDAIKKVKQKIKKGYVLVESKVNNE